MKGMQLKGARSSVFVENFYVTWNLIQYEIYYNGKSKSINLLLFNKVQNEFHV